MLVLVVDDSPDTARMMSKLLGLNGHTVTTAASFAEAILQCKNCTFDLMICDILLGDGCGLELMRTLKGWRVTRGIAVTGLSDDETKRKISDAGFSGHFVKPINFSKLLVAVGTSVPHV